MTAAGTITDNGLAIDTASFPVGYEGSVSVNTVANPDQVELTVTAKPAGLRGTYYDNIDFTGATATRVDSTINFDPFTSPAITGLTDNNTFSVRWVGKVIPEHSETYTFYVNSDDGSRLWVNGSQLIDRWVDQGPTEHSGSISLTAGQAYDIILEYRENGGGEECQLRWSSASTTKEIIPSSAMFVDPSLTLGEHTAGQESDNFDESGTAIVTELVAFSLTPADGTATVTSVDLAITGVTGIVDGDVSNIQLWIDTNNDGDIDDPGDTLVDGAGVLTLAQTLSLSQAASLSARQQTRSPVPLSQT